MIKLNDIDWRKIKLYHGTTGQNIKKILSDGFHVIPTNDGNWLGRGTYFAVNNVFLPILFSKKQAKKHGDVPAIIEINGEFLSEDIKSKILDLTSQPGINMFHNISYDFTNFLKPYEKYQELQNELNQLEKHFASSPFYNEKIKPNLIPNIDWFVFAIGTSNITKNYDDYEKGIKELKRISKKNITNVIFDWFNYKYSCGIEKDVPIKGIMAHFNTGTPIALASVLKKTKIQRGFADYISYLNRTELSIFGYNYYCKENGNAFWNFKKLFHKSPKKGKHYKTYIDIGPIERLLTNSFKKSNMLDFKIDEQYIIEIYNLLIDEEDSNGS